MELLVEALSPFPGDDAALAGSAAATWLANRACIEDIAARIKGAGSELLTDAAHLASIALSVLDELNRSFGPAAPQPDASAQPGRNELR